MKRPRVERGRRARWARAARRWAAVPGGEQLAAAQVLALWAGAEVALRLLPLPRACRLFGVRLTPRSTPANGPAQRADTDLPPEVQGRVNEARASVDRVLRVVHPTGACLRRALVLGRLLREFDPVLRIGVARGADKFEAHAWLEVDGRVIAEGSGSVDGAFVPLRPANPR